MCEMTCYVIKERRNRWKIQLTELENDFYIALVNSITARKVVEFQQLTNSIDEFKNWINKTIYIKKSDDERHDVKVRGNRRETGDGMILPGKRNSNPDSTGCDKYSAMTLCHLAAINNTRGILKLLLQHGGDLSKSILEINQQGNDKNVTRQHTVLSLILIHFREPIIFLRNLLDESISCEDKENDIEFTLDFAVLCPNTNDSWATDYIEKAPIKQMTVLNSILNSTEDIHSEQYELLKHPLIESFLTCKWKHYRRFFFTLVILHMLFVASISSAIMSVVKCFQRFHNESIINLVTKNFSSLEANRTEMERVVAVAEQFDFIIGFIQIFNALAVVFGAFLFVHAIIQASFIPLKKLMWELEIVLNLFTAPCAMYICIYMLAMPVEGYFDNGYRWIYHVMISFIFLIIGFALSFSLVFPKSEFFSDPGHAALRTIVMMVGEFDYMTTFSDEENYFIIGTSRLIFLLFIISCSIILMNLTQGIAVNDIKLLHEISQVIRLEKEMRFLYELECVFSHPMMTSHPFFRKIKRELYDHGTQIVPIKVTRDTKQGISNSVYEKLMKEYKFTK